ncbi:MAG: ThiF family adenylyltransferase [Nanoarchaeota archaeon]|nr:ThiF family adenylyltransferase [Nanoarchaeota archaeon]
MKRYSRQTIFPKIGKEGQKKLLESKALVIGVGALGSNIANTLTRAGIGNIKIVDRDYVELNNLQRQVLFEEKDVGSYKALAALEKLKNINSSIKIEAEITDVNHRNIESMVQEADIVLDGTDNFETRLMINDACIKNAKPWVYGAVIGSIGMSMNILPEGPCLRCFVKDIPSPGSQQTCDTSGVVNTIPSIIAAYEATEAVKILLKDKDISKSLFNVDVWEGVYDHFEIKKDEGCNCCVKKDFEFLTSKHSYNLTSLCGSNAVQVMPPENEEVNMKLLEEKLSKVGLVRSAPGILEFEIDNYRFTIFSSGSAIIRGTTDKDLAKSLYAKYVGR